MKFFLPKRVVLCLSVVFVACFGLQMADAFVAPNVFVIDVATKGQEYESGGNIEGSFVSFTTDSIGHGDIFYLVSIGKVEENGNVSRIDSQKIGPYFLEPGNKKTIDYSMPVSAIVSGEGNIVIRVQALTDKELRLGWGDSAPLTVFGNKKEILIQDSQIVDNTNRVYRLQDGPTIYKDKDPKAVSVGFSLINFSANPVELTPIIKIKKWGTDQVNEFKEKKIIVQNTFDPQAFSILLSNQDYVPGVYTGSLELIDSDGINRIKDFDFRYIVAGDIVTIQSLTADKTSLMQDESLKMTLLVTGTPIDYFSSNQADIDSQQTQNLVFDVALYNEYDRLVGKTALNKVVSVYESFDLEIVAGKQAKALRAVAMARKGELTVAEYKAFLTPDYEKIRSDAKRDRLLKVVGSGVGILLICLFIIFKIRRNKKVGLALLCFLAVSMIGASSANAYVVDGDASEVIITISSPYDDQALSPGQAFQVAGSMYYSACNNSNTSGYIYTTNSSNGQQVGGLLHSENRTCESVKTGGECRPRSGGSCNSNRAGDNCGYDSDCQTTNHPKCDCIGETTQQICGKDHSVEQDGDVFSHNHTAPSTPGIYRINIQGSSYWGGEIRQTETGHVQYKVLPGIVTNVTASPSSECGGKIVLTWTAGQGANSYAIYRSSTVSGAYTLIATTTNTTFIDTALSPDSTYYYKVSSRHTASGLESAQSSVVSSQSSQTCSVSSSCQANPASGTTEGAISWTVSTSPAQFNPTSFNWSGTDGLTGAAATVSKQYTQQGAKTASVTISGNINGEATSTVATCSATVTCPSGTVACPTGICRPDGQCPSVPTVSCSVPATSQVDGSVVWTASPAQGVPPYSYRWLGAVTGTTQNITRSFSTAGLLSAQVELTDSEGQIVISPNCSTTVSCPTGSYACPDNTCGCNALGVTCSANVTQTSVGSSVVWSATVTDGLAPYTYSWSGDALSGTGNTVSTTYSSEGFKNAFVTVTDNAGTVRTSSQCSVQITSVDQFTASCAVTPTTTDYNQSTTWNASASGGTAPYTYTWYGAVSGTGSQKSAQFTTAGQKSAHVVIADANGMIATSDPCSTNVCPSGNCLNNAPVASCSVSPTTLAPNQSTTWNASASGGTAPYTYTWYGDVTGSGANQSVSYSSSGTYSGRVVVTDANGNTDTSDICAVQVCAGGVCGNSLSADCGVNPTIAYVNETDVVWSGSGSGGVPPYNFDWSGAVTENQQTIIKKFTAVGTFSAAVKVIDAIGQEVTSSNCQVVVRNNTCTQDTDCPGTMECTSGRCTSSFDASCSGSPSRVQTNQLVTWSSSVVGGNSPYTYVWRQSASGNNSTAIESYSEVGRKYANVRVTDSSSRNTVSSQCSVLVCDGDNCGEVTDSCTSATCTINVKNPRLIPAIADSVNGQCVAYWDVESTDPYTCTFGGNNIGLEADNSYQRTMTVGDKTVTCTNTISLDTTSHRFTCSPNPAFNQF